ncbi:MAG: hypothetical protein ABR977_04660 [Candidatus Dormibacteria bacterium]
MRKRARRLVPLGATGILLLAGCSSSPAARTTPASPASSASGGSAAKTCIQRWQLTAAPVPSGDAAASTDLSGVAAISPADVWAVGSTSPAGKDQQTLAERWDGSSWAIVPAPDPASAASLGGDQLIAVAGVSPDDVWAVGYIGAMAPPVLGASFTPAAQTLTEHWNGTSWSIVDAPDVAARDGIEPWDVLTSVAAISSDDVWATGVSEWPLTFDDEGQVAAQPLVEHWNGKYWAIVSVPDPEPAPPDWALASGGVPPSATATVASVALLGVTGSSPADVWLVGGYEPDMGVQNYQPGPWETLTEHWNGTAWSVVQAPDATLPEPLSDGSKAADDLLTAAAETPAGNLWAVGGALPGSALTLQMGDGAWSLIPSLAVSAENDGEARPVAQWPGYTTAGANAPTFFSGTSPLLSVITLSAVNAWAVGAVILHWDGTSWQPLYTVNGQSFGYLTGVAAGGSGGLWAVGGTSIVHATCV